MVPKLKALGDDSRLAILELLAKNGELCGCDIEEKFSISQSTVSHHMKILINVNLVTERKVGRSHYYSINREAIKKMINSLEVKLL
ncbi:ArsR/SmtB family transcription factor [Ligilactobacillus sp. LYQ135]